MKTIMTGLKVFFKAHFDYRNQKVKKRFLCSFIMCVFALIATIILSLSEGGVIFLLPCGLSGLIVGFVILPFFIKDEGAEEFQFGRSISGGILSVVIAIPICVVLLLLLWGGPDHMSFLEESLGKMIGSIIFVSIMGIIFMGPVSIPAGVLGALIAQIIWWKSTRIKYAVKTVRKGEIYE